IRLQQRVLPDLVEVELRNVVDEVRRQSGFRLGKRQLPRPAVWLRNMKRRRALVLDPDVGVRGVGVLDARQFGAGVGVLWPRAAQRRASTLVGRAGIAGSWSRHCAIRAPAERASSRILTPAADT